MLSFNYITFCKKAISYFLLGFSIISIFAKDIFLNQNINSDISKLTQNNNCNLLFLYPEGACFSA